MRSRAYTCLMKTMRPFLYGLIGLVVGAIVGVAIGGSLFPAPEGADISYVAVGTIIACALLGAFGLGMLGRKFSRMQQQSEQKGGYFSVANRIGVVILIATAIISALGGLVPGYSTNLLVTYLVSAVITAIACWLGVLYCAKRMKLTPSLAAGKLATWVAGIFLILYVVVDALLYMASQTPEGAQYPISAAFYGSEILNLVVIYAAVYFFANRALKSAPATSSTSYSS